MIELNAIITRGIRKATDCLKLQWPCFPVEVRERTGLHRATVNVDLDHPLFLGPTRLISPVTGWLPGKPDFRETFRFYPVTFLFRGAGYDGFIYDASESPHRANAYRHELLLPWIDGLAYDQPAAVRLPAASTESLPLLCCR